MWAFKKEIFKTENVTFTPLNCSFTVIAEDVTPTVLDNVQISVRRFNPSYPPKTYNSTYPSNNSVKVYMSSDNVNWELLYTSAIGGYFDSYLLTIQPGTPLYIGIKHRYSSQLNTYVNTAFGVGITGYPYTEPTVVGYGYCGTLPNSSYYYGLVPNTDIDLYFELAVSSDAYVQCYG